MHSHARQVRLQWQGMESLLYIVFITRTNHASDVCEALETIIDAAVSRMLFFFHSEAIRRMQACNGNHWQDMDYILSIELCFSSAIPRKMSTLPIIS